MIHCHDRWSRDDAVKDVELAKELGEIDRIATWSHVVYCLACGSANSITQTGHVGVKPGRQRSAGTMGEYLRCSDSRRSTGLGAPAGEFESRGKPAAATRVEAQARWRSSTRFGLEVDRLSG